jgi:hypothetical protein
LGATDRFQGINFYSARNNRNLTIFLLSCIFDNENIVKEGL